MYRLFTFTTEKLRWGYPAPHLLAMHYYPGGSTGGEARDQIELHFSIEGVRIVGSSLSDLWHRLMAGGGGIDPKEHIVVVSGREGVEKISHVDYHANKPGESDQNEG
jgi:hypothetical protein